MDEEAADERVDWQGHDFLAHAPLGPVILPLEGNAPLIEADQAAVGDGHAVGVAAELGEHRLRPGEGALGVEDPLDLAQGAEMVIEGMGLGKMAEIAEEVQASGIVGGYQLLQEHSAEQPREHAHGQEEAGPAGDPLCAVT